MFRKTLLSVTGIIIAAAMVFAAAISGEKEIIFPEIAALVIGCLLADKKPWNVPDLLIVAFIAVFSSLGVVIVRLVPLHLYLQSVIAYFVCLTVLSLTGCTFFPAISAAILPIYFGTESWIYPISATVITGLIVLARRIYIKAGWLKSSEFKRIPTNHIIYIKRLLLACAIMLPPLIYKQYLFAAPPLLVAFTELSNSESQARNKTFKIYLISVLCAAIGTVSRYVLSNICGMSIAICACVAFAIIIIVMSVTKIYFPPAGALGILPMIIKQEYLLFYPVFIAVGFLAMILCDVLVFPKKGRNEKKQQNSI